MSKNGYLKELKWYFYLLVYNFRWIKIFVLKIVRNPSFWMHWRLQKLQILLRYQIQCLMIPFFWKHIFVTNIFHTLSQNKISHIYPDHRFLGSRPFHDCYRIHIFRFLIKTDLTAEFFDKEKSRFVWRMMFFGYY